MATCPKGLAPDRTSFSSEEMVTELYSELRRLASIKMLKAASGQTLQATALVHEAYLRLSTDPSKRWDNRGHFFASAAEAMRRILVEQARRRAALRHGGGVQRVPVESVDLQTPEPDDRILKVHEALEQLEREDGLLAQIIKLRFFVGLEHREIAALLQVSEKTVRRQWTLAKISIHQKISSKNLSEL